MSDDLFKEEFKRFRKWSGDFQVSELIDFSSPEAIRNNQGGDLLRLSMSLSKSKASARRLGLLPPDQWTAFTLEEVPGLYLIPNPFQDGCQHYWVKQCLVTYPCKPNVCNLDAHMVRTGDGSIWPENLSVSTSSKEGSQDSSKVPLGDLLQKLRWVTLGYHYDWTAKVYHMEHRSPFPPDLTELSTFILDVVGFSNFVPEAAIVNFYNLGSTLSGHTDHSEVDLECPLLSISFGQSAVFLVGGATKQVRPKAILLQSGDVIVMSGASRLAYHGIPKIIPPCKGVEVPPCLSLEALLGRYHQDVREQQEGREQCLCTEPDATWTGAVGCLCLANGWPEFASYLSYSRINVNIRQVLSHNVIHNNELQTV